MSRKFIVVGNWKMNGNQKQAQEMLMNLFISALDPKVEVILGVPSIYMSFVKNITPPRIEIAAQNCWKVSQGAFTGEISPAMIKDVEVSWVILGQSERRTVFGETDELIAQKVGHALDWGLKVIACIGENIEDKNAGKSKEVVYRQIEALDSAIGKRWNKVVLAYEPVWAIGTGTIVTPQQAQEMHARLRNWLTSNTSVNVAESVRILYGGTVTACNAQELANSPDIDGFLVGVVSLQPEFVDIINATF